MANKIRFKFKNNIQYTFVIFAFCNYEKNYGNLFRGKISKNKNGGFLFKRNINEIVGSILVIH